MREIAAALNAGFILEASVEHEPNGLLVTTRIVSAETDRKIWVADYRGAADDVRGISQRIAFDVSAELLRRAPLVVVFTSRVVARELFEEAQRLHRLHPIEEQHAIEMVVLVLHDPGGKIL